VLLKSSSLLWQGFPTPLSESRDCITTQLTKGSGKVLCLLDLLCLHSCNVDFEARLQLCESGRHLPSMLAGITARFPRHVPLLFEECHVFCHGRDAAVQLVDRLVARCQLAGLCCSRSQPPSAVAQLVLECAYRTQCFVHRGWLSLCGVFLQPRDRAGDVVRDPGIPTKVTDGISNDERGSNGRDGESTQTHAAGAAHGGGHSVGLVQWPRAFV